MIFVTLGTQHQRFDRLFDYINKMPSQEKIIIQKGNAKYNITKKAEVYDYLKYEKQENYIKKADIVIAHGGGGTIFKALELKKKLIVVPRKAKYKEHINDHQIEFCKYLRKENLCLVAETEEEFFECIKKIHTHKFKTYKSNPEKFIKNIEKEINKLLEV